MGGLIFAPPTRKQVLLRGSYAVPAPHLAPTSARLPLKSTKNFAQHLSWKT